MSSIENIVRFNAQTSSREKLIRLCQYSTRLLLSLGVRFDLMNDEARARLRHLEQYFLSCRRLLNFGRAIDHMFAAVQCLRIEDPIVRFTLMSSKVATSVCMLCEHVLWLKEMNFVPWQDSHKDRERLARRFNKFWLYASGLNVLRDFYELICILLTYHHSHQRPHISCDDDQTITLNNNHESAKTTTTKHHRHRNSTNDSKPQDLEARVAGLGRRLSASAAHTYTRWRSWPVSLVRRHPRLTCDLIKNACDFCIPCTALGKTNISPVMLALMGVTSSALGALQIYNPHYRLAPS
ncbi:Peroxisomal membrane protein 11B [Fragariocoptes setiger]|uniref:Peroxisomal membrane protein 11B n=1 Tax=Fragariocoptes setiger TaxID=1670756 RepID=A0ABQ7S743_9ACAR|nr:Peroxisomal membrane protein 11B [Fragariocoptes setiger]